MFGGDGEEKNEIRSRHQRAGFLSKLCVRIVMLAWTRQSSAGSIPPPLFSSRRAGP